MIPPTESPESLLAAVEAHTLPKSLWTHEAHLTIGLAVLSERNDPQAALDHLRVTIASYNVATGGENTDTAGYHETITAFYVWAIGQFLQERRAASGSRTLTDLALALCASSWGHRDTIRRYFSREALASVLARRTAIRPDLDDIPTWPFQPGNPIRA